GGRPAEPGPGVAARRDRGGQGEGGQQEAGAHGAGFSGGVGGEDSSLAAGATGDNGQAARDKLNCRADPDTLPCPPRTPNSTGCATPTSCPRGGGGGRTSPTVNGGLYARTTRPSATRGRTSPSRTRTAGPTAGARTGSPASPTTD